MIEKTFRFVVNFLILMIVGFVSFIMEAGDYFSGRKRRRAQVKK